MKRGAALLLLALGAAACAPAREQPRARNVILLSIDTLRADHLQTWGYDRPTSPFLTSLAERGTVFLAAYSQAPWTLPSHASLLMSRAPSSLGKGVWERPHRLPESAVSIAEVLHDAGLRTHAVVNGGFVSATFGLGQGFEEYDEHDRRTAATVRRAGRWLETLAPDERFFLFLHTYEVHEYDPPPEVAAEFAHLYSGYLDELGDQLPRFVQDREMDSDLPDLDEAARQHVVDLYDAGIRSVDDAVAELWALLEERGLVDDTLLVVTSDHGEELFEHGGTGHGYTLHDENTHVPLILVGAGLPARRVSQQVRLLDVSPTLAELAGVPAPPEWEGVSLLRVLEGDTTPRPAFSEQAHHPFVSLRLAGPTGTLKYIRGADGGQLYDLAADPGEEHDLAGHAPAEADLRGQLDAWIVAHDAWPPPSGSGPPQLEDELLDQLRRLGYVGADEEDEE